MKKPPRGEPAPSTSRYVAGIARNRAQQINVLQEVMGELGAGLRRSLKTSAALQHALSTGEFREAVVRQALVKHLPGRFSVSSGVILNAAGQVSKQQDLIVTDSLVSSPFLAEGVIGLHPAETVAAVIEVKSAATGASVADGVAKCASVKSLYSDEPRPFTSVDQGGIAMGATSEKPFAGVICLGSSGNADTVFNRYVDEVRGLPEINRPNALMVLDQFIITWHEGEPPNLLLLPSPLGARFATRQDLGDSSLLLFYLVLMESFRRYHAPPLDLLDYVNGAGGAGAHEMAVQPI